MVQNCLKFLGRNQIQNLKLTSTGITNLTHQENASGKCVAVEQARCMKEIACCHDPADINDTLYSNADKEEGSF